jgi:hypothetical protein
MRTHKFDTHSITHMCNILPTLRDRIPSGQIDPDKTPFRLDRPSLFEGDKRMQQKQSAPINNRYSRYGIGNFEIIRPSFLNADILPRQLTDFGRLQEIEDEQQGLKVRLGKDTLNKLTQVQIPDNADLEWLAEKKRLTEMYRKQGLSDEQIQIQLSVNKPLGRDQRTRTESRHIASLNTLGAKLQELKEELQKTNTKTSSMEAALTGQLAGYLASIPEIEQLSKDNQKDLIDILIELNNPINHKQLGLKKTVIDNEYYKANMGAIHLVLLNRVYKAGEQDYYNFKTPVKNSDDKKQPYITLSSMATKLSVDAKQHFLDLAPDGGMLTMGELIERANKLRDGINDFDWAISDKSRANITKQIIDGNVPALNIPIPPPPP